MFYLEEPSKSSPNIEIGLDYAEYSGVIFGVSYSQKRKAVAKLADKYISASHGSVQAVVGLDIKYGQQASHEATCTFWRLHRNERRRELYVATDNENEHFCEHDGTLSNNPGLQLRLSEFGFLNAWLRLRLPPTTTAISSSPRKRSANT